MLQSFEAFGPIESTYIPPSAHGSKARYGFIMYKNAKDAQSAVESLSQSYKPLHTLLDQPLSNEPQARVLSKHEWNTRMREYQSLLETRKQQLIQLKESRAGSHPPAAYERGIMAQFTHVHPDTNSKTLKHLFELVAPVAYIDLDYKQQRGHVRFKTRQGAQFACQYFSQTCIYQSSGSDTGTLFTLSKNTKKESPPFVQLRLLKGQEESAYWDQISERQSASRKRKVEQEKAEFVAKKSHITFEDERAQDD